MTTRMHLERLALHPWATRTASVFVLATLVALVVVPVLVQRHVDMLRRQVEVAEPARTLLARLQFDLVREMSALTELRLSGAREFSDAYAAAEAEERAVLGQLRPLATELGPAVLEPYVEARTLARRWHERVAREGLARERSEPPDSAQILEDDAVFEAVLRAVSAVDLAVLRVTAENRAEIVAAERAGLQLTILLGALALLAAAMVGVLSLRVQRFAKEAERRRDEAEAALREVARANDARVRLLRGITHDVKNPLGAAKGYAELLAMGVKAPMSPEQAPLVSGVQRSVDGALAIISDLLDFARADGGGLHIRRERADLAAIARQAVDDHRAEAEAAGHTIHFDNTAGAVEIYTDAARVRQVMGNLLGNAIKYTPPPGRITVGIEFVEVDHAPRIGRWAVVRVADTGPGIPPDQREAIFDEFTRLDEGSGVQGHGLGLAIARRIAHLLDGDLSVAETPAPGAVFLFWLPRRKPSADEIA